MLNLAPGDSEAARLRERGVEGDVLPWRDILHEGPVPDAPPAEFRAVRAAFLATAYGVPENEVLEDMRARDERLERAVRSGEEIRRHFETDLYDQLQLLDIERRVGATPAAWTALTAPTPEAWPEHAVLHRLCEQLPWTTDGLTRSERQLLQVVAEGALSKEEAFIRAQNIEEDPFLGDTTAWAYLERMSELVTPEPLALTPVGTGVLGGAAAWEDRPPFPLGGTENATLWRWDPESGTVARLDG